MFNNLRELILSMPTEETCRDYIAKQRWENGKPICPHCGHNHCYVIDGGKRFKCGSKTCYKRFSVMTGTVMEASNIPLTKWLSAIYLVTAHKKGISSYQLGRDLGIAQKNSWFMLHRIREMLRPKEDAVLGLNDVVEADETFIGGKYGNMHKSKRAKLLANGSSFSNKTTVLGMIERNGLLVTKVIPQRNSYHLAKEVSKNVQKDATLITDDTNLYDRIKSGYKHHSVNHTQLEFVKAGGIHTNTIEGAFSLLKRGIIGIYHQISAKHTQRYCDEFAYRYNYRKMKDAQRFTFAMKTIEGRLSYKMLIANPVVEDAETITLSANSGNGVFQVKDGELIAHFKSIYAAVKATKIQKNSIRKACKGQQKSAGGFEWYYA